MIARSQQELRSIIDQHVPAGAPIAVTFSSWAYRSFLFNWILLGRDALQHPVVAAFDAPTAEAAARRGVIVLSLESGLDMTDFRGRPMMFHQMAKAKTGLVELIVELDHPLLLSDTDVVWAKAPYEHFEMYPEVI